MSWNGYLNNVSKFLIKMLQCKYKADGSGIQTPYWGSQEENLSSSCLKKMRHCLKQPVKFIFHIQH